MSKQDEHRIAACVKACEGISTENLTNNVPLKQGLAGLNQRIRDAEAQRDNLLAAWEAGKTLIAQQSKRIAELEARPVTPLKFSEGADADSCREWAWNETKKELNTEQWKAEDNGNFYGFFLTGWHARLQYNEQRRAENLRIAMLSGLTRPLSLELPPTRMTLAESKRRNMTWRELGSYNEGADVAVEKISKTLAAAGINLVLGGDVQTRKGDVS